MFAEDLTALFDTVSGFGEWVALEGVPVRAIFDAAFIEARVGELGIESTKAACLVLDKEAPNVAHEQTLARGVITYRVVPPIEPDGAGLTLLHLEKQP